MTVEIAWDVPPESRSALAVGDEEVTQACLAAMQVGEREGLELSVVFVTDEVLCELHERFLDDPTPTDVITFDLSDPGEGPAGELYVSIEAAHRGAREFGLAVDNELLLYVVHGFPPDTWAGTEIYTFNLASEMQRRGHRCTILYRAEAEGDEPDERRAMREAEVRTLERIGVQIDAARHAEL